MNNDPDKWLRWSINTFVFLICFQLGMLLYFKSVFYHAEQKLKKNEAQVAFTCKDFNDESSYWSLSESDNNFVQSCQDKFCPDSYWKNSPQQDESLQVVSAKKAQPGEKTDGNLQYVPFADVKVFQSPKPVRIALVSQNMMLWNLKVDKNSQLKEVMVIGPDLVWVEGVPKDVKLTYFSKDTICSYPTGWEEFQNPENEFRRLYRALYEYTGLHVDTFQGQNLAREFRVPLRSPLLEDRMKSGGERQLSSSEHTGLTGLGVQWAREGKSLKAIGFQYFDNGQMQKIAVPESTMDGYFDAESKKLFVINRHRFGTWDGTTEAFTPIHLPLALPALHWPSAMAVNRATGEIFIYNEDRGGEILAYNFKENTWRVVAIGVGYSFVALHYDSKNQKLLGTRVTMQKIAELVTFDNEGRELGRVSFSKALDFSKNRWKAHIISDAEDYWLKVTHPAHPGGDIYPLSEAKQSM